MQKARKPQGLIAWLTTAQREQLDRWLLANTYTYAELVKRVRAEFDVKTSESALGNYYHHKLFKELVADQTAVVTMLPDAGIEIIIHRPQPGVWRVVVRPQEPAAETGKATIAETGV